MVLGRGNGGAKAFRWDLVIVLEADALRRPRSSKFVLERREVVGDDSPEE